MAASGSSPFASRLSRIAARLLPLSFFLLALVFLWPLTLHPDFVPFPPRSEFTDLLITHLPNAQYIRDSLAQHGQLPLWNAQIFGGQPFAADPLAGLWYPPNLLLLFLPLPLAFNLLLALHLAWAGWGLFGFLRREGLSLGPALLGSLAFEGTPKLIAHLGAGHVSLVFAVAWTPWLLLAVRRAARNGSLRRGALAGACLALIFLADVRWAFYAAALGVAYWVSLFPPFARPGFAERAGGPRREGRAGLWAALGFGLFFLSLSAILALPLWEFVVHSNRSALTLEEAAAFSLPPYPYLLGLAIPDLGGFHEWMTYLGVIPLLLALAGIRRSTLFWVAAALAAAAFSLGSNFVLFPTLFRLLPGLGFLRVPPRAWFVVALGVSTLAAHGAQSLKTDLVPWLVRRYMLTHTHTPTLKVLPPALLLLTLLDLLRVDSTLLVARPLPAPVPAVEWIAAQPGLLRVYSPSYSLPAGDALEHVDGVNPLQLADSARFIEAASGVRATGYSVALPAFESRGGPGDGMGQVDVALANAGATPDAIRLGLLNVKYVAAEFPLDVPELRWVQTFGRTRVYENAASRPRAWMEGGGTADVLEWTPNRIRVRARGPGRLVLSEVVYPGWEARVGGVLTPIETVEGILRAVRLGDGEHEIVLEFRSRTLLVGAAITALGWMALAGVWRWGA